jgi:hypothetical protein
MTQSHTEAGGRTARRRSCLLLAGAVVLILALTLAPADAPGTAFRLDFEFTGFRFGADAIVNVLLFLPFGAAGALCLGARRAVLTGLALSLGIELAQLLVPGRYTSPSDVVFNTAGAALGVLLTRHARVWLLPGRRFSAALTVLATSAAAAVVLGGSLLFAPSVPLIPLYGQWTAEFGNMEPYRGEVTASSVGGLQVYSRIVRDTPRLRTSLLAGDTVRVHFSAGPPPPSPAPVFSIYDARAREVLLIAADGHDVFLRYRMRATAIGFDQPHLIMAGALRPLQTGRDATLRYWRDGPATCLAVQETSICDPGLTPADTWSLLLFPVPRPLGAVLPWIWLACLLLPAGFWSRTPGRAAAAGLTFCAVLALTSTIAPVRPADPSHYASALAGLAAGFALSRAVERRSGSPVGGRTAA